MCPRNPIITLCISNPSQCGGVRILKLLAWPTHHFVGARSLSSRHGAYLGFYFDVVQHEDESNIGLLT